MSSEDYDGINIIMTKMNELNITELIIRKDNTGISLKSSESSEPHLKFESSPPSEKETRLIPDPSHKPSKKSSQKVSPKKQDSEAKTEKEEKHTTIDSPLVGKFYSAPAPGKPTYVTIGDTA